MPISLRSSRPFGVRSALRLAALLALVALMVPDAHAQRRGQFGIGGQVGEPTGLTLKFGAGRGAFDLAAGWNLHTDRFFAQGHYLLAEQRLSGSPVGLFYGPGLFVAGGEGDTAFGLSFNVGLNYYTGPIELFGQVTPRLQLVEETDFDLGAAIGLRFYP